MPGPRNQSRWKPSTYAFTEKIILKSIYFSVGILYICPVTNQSMKTKNTVLGAKRRLQVAQGAYDGRFTCKRVEDKKKLASLRECRKKVNYF